MRPLFLLLFAASSSAALATPSPADPPQRMTGLWLMNAAPANQAAKASSFHVCVGKTDSEVLNHPGNPLTNCREQAWSKDGFYRYYRATCEAKGSTAVVEGKFAGDFQYNFQGELTTRYTPLLDGVDTTRIDIDGRRLGPCRGGVPEGGFLIKGQDGVENLNLSGDNRGKAR